MKIDNNDVIDKIYNETLKLIFTYGAKGWTMDTVCKKSGIAKDTLYRIISKKEELIKNALLRELDMHDKKMGDLLVKDKEFFSTLNDSATLVSELLAKFSLEKLSNIFIQYPSIESEINKGMVAYFQSFEDFLDRGKSSGCLKKEVNSKLLISFIHASIMHMLKQPEAYNTSKDTQTLLNYLVEGIKA